MKTSFAGAVLLAASLILTVGAAPATAWSEPSVFPRPVDPWSSWGRPRPPAATRVLPPATGYVVPAPQPVWVPGFWAWDGFAWVWVSPHWSHRRWNAW